jgi:hypothetical protein
MTLLILINLTSINSGFYMSIERINNRLKHLLRFNASPLSFSCMQLAHDMLLKEPTPRVEGNRFKLI